ncbi:MAG: hypothetical protein Q9195_005426 [Heterodermia aff. obscurata]
MPANIYIIGAQCTGKTTLVTALQAHLRGQVSPTSQGQSTSLPIITEVARTVLREHNFTASDITSSPSKSLAFQQLILKAQYDAETSISEPWFISDRSGLDPIIYAKKYVGSNAAELMMGTEIWRNLRERMSRSLIIVCEAGMDWLTDDGVRLMPVDKADWIAFHELFCNTIREVELDFSVLPRSMKDIEQRVDFVLSLHARMR